MISLDLDIFRETDAFIIAAVSLDIAVQNAVEHLLCDRFILDRDHSFAVYHDGISLRLDITHIGKAPQYGVRIIDLLAEFDHRLERNVRFRINDDAGAVFLCQCLADQIENLEDIALLLDDTERSAVVGIFVVDAGRIDADRADNHNAADCKVLDDLLAVLLQTDVHIMPFPGSMHKGLSEKPCDNILTLVEFYNKIAADIDDFIPLSP